MILPPEAPTEVPRPKQLAARIQLDGLAGFWGALPTARSQHHFGGFHGGSPKLQLVCDFSQWIGLRENLPETIDFTIEYIEYRVFL